MKLKTPKPAANFWIIAGTLTFFILSYFIYLDHYVPNKESEIISTRFRVLDQLGDNINAKIESYNHNVLSLENKIQDTVNSLKNQFETYEIFFPKEQLVPYILEGFKQGNYQEFLNKDLQVVDYKLDYGKKGPAEKEEDELTKTETDKFFYFNPIAIKTESTVDGDTEVYHDSVLVRVKYESILNGLTRDDVFDGMFIIRNDEFIFSTLKSDMLIEKSNGGQDILELIFNKQDPPKPSEKVDLKKTGPKLSLQEHIISGEYGDITISNKDYKLFFKPIKVEGGYWFLGGLMEVRNFNIAGRSIPQQVIIFLSLLLILIVLGMPFIKLKIISKTEHLKTSTIVNSALAILLGTSVLTLFLLYISQNTFRLQNADRRLVKMSAEIDSTFSNEIANAFHQLEMMDLRYESYSFDVISQKNNKPIIQNILNLPDSNPARPDIYPFADYIFWANKNGLQTAFLTPFKEMTGEMPNIKQRDYFNKKDEWFFPPDPSKKFRFESILSIRTGDHKVAVGTSSSVRNNPVIALTSRFYSLIDPIIAKNFGFCIIDEDGEVWFHSDKYRNLMENFVNECNSNDNLKAALYNRTSTPVDITYYNKPHRAFVQPLKQLPLYLVTFYNWDTETSFQSQVFTMALILNCLFFIFLFMEVIILLVLEKRFQWKLNKNLIMRISRPMAHLNHHYRFLILVYLAVTLVTAIGIHNMGKTQSFVTIYMVGIIIFTFSFRVLNDNDLKKNQVNWFTGINMVFLILLNVALTMLVNMVDVFIILAFQLLMIFVLQKAYQSFKHKLKESESRGSQIFVKNYVRFLLALSVIFAILPTMIFYEIAYNKESEIRLRHYQVDLMKKREERNATWNKYYSLMSDSPASAAQIQERKNRGIYTHFLNDLTFTQTPIPPAEKEKELIKTTVLDSLFYYLRPFYDEEIVENKFMIFGNQNNSNKYWINYGGDSLVLKYISNTEDPKFKKQEYIRIAGNVEKFNYLMPYPHQEFFDLKSFLNNSVFWIIMLFILFICYHLIKFGVRYIYSLDIVANFSRESFNELIRNHYLPNKCIFFVRLSPKDEVLAFPVDLAFDLRLDWSDKEVIEGSETLIAKCLAESNKNDFVTIFIDHFEWGYMSPDIFKNKLEIVLKYIQHKEIHWIIRSNETPERLLAYYQDLTDPDKNMAPEDLNTGFPDLVLYKKILKDLQKLNNSSVIQQLPMKSICTKEEEEYHPGPQAKKLDLEGLIKEELNACDYLGQFKETINTYYHSYIYGHFREDPEVLIVDKINALADSYYEDLFNSCSPEEQYVMFDIADDLILNQKNTKAIFGLLEKGLLIKKYDKINFMNISFRRFILAQKTRVDTADLEIKIGKKSGAWQGYRIMFFLIIVSLFIFISMANQDFIKNLNQIFIVIGGGIASITGVLGLLARNNKTTSQ